MSERNLTIIPAVFFVVVLLFPSTVNADTKHIETTIKSLVRKVKTSKGDDRRRAMNALKLKLREANANTRREVMSQLRKSFAKPHQTHTAHPARTTKEMHHVKGSLSPAFHGGSLRNVPHPHIPPNNPQRPQNNFPKQPKVPTGGRGMH